MPTGSASKRVLRREICPVMGVGMGVWINIGTQRQVLEPWTCAQGRGKVRLLAARSGPTPSRDIPRGGHAGEDFARGAGVVPLTAGGHRAGQAIGRSVRRATLSAHASRNEH